MDRQICDATVCSTSLEQLHPRMRGYSNCPYFFLLQKRVDINYWEAECFKIDAKNKKVYCRPNPESSVNGKEGFAVEYDYLVIAMGARPNTFNTPGVVEHCFFLKVTSLTVFSIHAYCFLFVVEQNRE